MKKVLFTFILGLLISVTNIQAQWTQVGADIAGEAVNDNFGYSVSLSSDGSIVAIGSRVNSGNGFNSGHVRVYKNIGGMWTQVGRDIDGEAAGDFSGCSVSLSSDGSIVAIGAYGNDGNGTDSGHVRIYKYNTGTWTQIGSDIDGESGDSSGYSVSLSSDGSVVAIGAPYNNGNGLNAGRVRVFKNNAGTWTQIGADIAGGSVKDNFGYSVSLSSDGSIVAIGAPHWFDSDPGYISIYKNNAGTWTQIGTNIDDGTADDPRTSGDWSGFSVSLSSDGSIVALGAPKNDDNGYESGRVRVFKNNAGTWTQIGADIDGEASNDNSGISVNLSSDGSIVAIGAYGNDGNGADSGHVRVFKNNAGTWTQIGANIDGEAAGDWSGFFVNLNSDGSIVAIGAPKNDGNGSDSGHVRVFKYNPVNISELKEAGISIYPNPSTGVFNIKNAKDYDITITDITGKVIYRTTATANEQVHLQQRGVYIINFKSQTKNFSSKIIVK